ncbi:unnamed protein product [Boreogadus saida]
MRGTGDRQIEAEFARLTSVYLKGSLFAGLDKYLLRFLEVYRARSGLVELNSLLSTLDNDSSNQRQRAVVLMGLPYYLKDVAKLYKKVQVTDAEEDWTKGMAVGILMVEQNDRVGFAVVLEEEIIFPSISDFPTAVALLMGLLFALNIDYPRGLRDEREEESDADSAGADQLPRDQTQPSQERQAHNDAESGEPVPCPLQLEPDFPGSRTDPED